MTLPEIYERFSALPLGGYITIDNRLDKGYMYSLIHSARAFVVQQRFAEQGVIQPVYFQQYKPDYIEAAQTSTSYARYSPFPAVIGVGAKRDGMGYVGSVCLNVPFRQVNSRAEFASMQFDRIMKAGRKAYVLVGNNYIEIYYKNKIKEVLIEAVFMDPTKVPNYNIEKDEYPVEAGDIARMEMYILQSDMNMISRSVSDRIKNDRDDSIQPFPRS